MLKRVWVMCRNVLKHLKPWDLISEVHDGWRQERSSWVEKEGDVPSLRSPKDLEHKPWINRGYTLIERNIRWLWQSLHLFTECPSSLCTVSLVQGQDIKDEGPAYVLPPCLGWSCESCHVRNERRNSARIRPQPWAVCIIGVLLTTSKSPGAKGFKQML